MTKLKVQRKPDYDLGHSGSFIQKRNAVCHLPLMDFLHSLTALPYIFVSN